VPRLLAFSDAAILGLHAMMYLALSKGDRPIPVSEIAEVLKASEAHLGKVMQRLGRLGLVRSRRGPRGGFTLGRTPEDVSLGEILAAIDGPLVRTQCLLDRADCVAGSCLMGGVMDRIHGILNDHISSTYLSDLLEDDETAAE